MFKFWLFFLKKDRFTYLLVLMLASMGIIAMFTIPKESTPEVKIPIGVVTTIMPGASAVDMEQLVTNEVENRVATLKDVKKVTSTSREGLSSVVVEFEASADIDESIDFLKDEIDIVKTKLPNEAEDPMVTKVDFANDPILIISISSDLPVTEFGSVINQVEDQLESIAGVSSVNIQGKLNKEVAVIVNKEQLEAFNIRLTDVVNAIRESNSSLPIGGIEVNGINYAVRFEGDIEKASDIEDIALNVAGRPVYIRDIAFVSDGVEKKTSISRVSVNGEPSKQGVALSVLKRSGGNILEIADSIYKKIDEMQSNGGILEGMDVIKSFDVAESVKDDLGNLTRSGLQTVILVMLVLLVAVGWRESLIAGLSIPLSFLISFILLLYSGNTINFVSLFSLILAIGILVDSAIVVIEAIHTHIKDGETRMLAASKTLKEYGWPLISGTMTTVAAFAPLFFISGITGEFISSIPFTVISVLLASLFVSLAFIPLFGEKYLVAREGGRLGELQDKTLGKLQKFYSKWLLERLGNKKFERKFIGGVILLLVIGILMPITGLLRVTFFPQEDLPFIFVDIEKPHGTSLAETDLAVRAVEEILYENKYIESFTTTIGSTSQFSGSGLSGSHLGNMTLNLRKDRDKTSTEIMEGLRDDLSVINTFEVRVFEPSSGPPTGAPILIRFNGENLEELEVTAGRAEQILKKIQGVSETSSSVNDSGLEFVFTIDRAKASELGISPSLIAQTLRIAISGVEATTIRNTENDINVITSLNLNSNYITTEDTIKTTVDSIRNLSINTPSGSVLIDSITDISIKRSNASITHENQKTIISVSGYLEDGFVAQDVVPELQKQLEIEIPNTNSIIWSIGGESEDIDQSFKEMFYALIAGIFLIALILVLQFNSFRYPIFIVSVPPLSLAGLLIGLTITFQTLSFPSLMGFITLAGIVVNNAIILIDAANRNREDGMDIKEAIINASTSRLRPILLTTLTTVVGIFPLVFASAIWGPLAYAVMFGLSYSLILTLILIPILYNKWPGKIR